MVELCIHAANLLYLGSFLCRDMLWLRVLTCGGMVLGVIFFTCQPAPMYGPTVWHFVFLGINAYQIGRLIRDRRQLTLTPEQATAGEALFGQLSREELLSLLTRAMCENPNRIRAYSDTGRAPLTDEQRALRDIALSRLSREELLNLLTRRVWNSVMLFSPQRRRRREAESPVPQPSGREPPVFRAAPSN